VRARLAFYVSTPAYRPAVEHHGLGDLARQLSLLARAQDWEKMPDYISDEILNLYAVIGTHDEIAERLCQRFGGIITNCEFSIAVKNDADKQRLTQIVKRVQADPLDAVAHRLTAPAGA
jgi:hypothetical protein